jgi:hypothetical protein
MVISHRHVRRGDHVAWHIAGEQQKEGLLPNMPIARVPRSLGRMIDGQRRQKSI